MLRVLLDVLLPIAVVALAGFLLRRNLSLDLATLNRVMIYGLMPSLIFVSLVRTDLLSDASLKMLLLSFLLVLALGLVTMACALPLRIQGRTLSGLLLAVMFINSGNYGLPAARFAFGEPGFTQALLFFIVQSTLAQTLGVAVATAGDTSEQQRRPALIFRRLLRMPQIYAVGAALLVRFSGIDLAGMSGLAGGFWRGMVLLSEAALPVMLMILGMQLATGVVIEHPRLVALASGLRLLVSPMLAYALGLALGLDSLALSVATMQAGMPTAVNTTIIALEFNAQPRLVVGTVVVSSLGSLATLSVLLTIIR